MDLINKNTISDLLTKAEETNYNAIGYPNNLSILYRALTSKLQADPDYEVWVPLVYFKCRQFVRDEKSPLVMYPHRIYISNKGSIISGSSRGVRVLTKISINDYLYTAICKNRRQFNALIHRAVACSFIPVPASLALFHQNDLQVNHLDGIKSNCAVGNLEWCTPLGNVLHAVGLGLRKPRGKGRK